MWKFQDGKDYYDKLLTYLHYGSVKPNYTEIKEFLGVVYPLI